MRKAIRDHLRDFIAILGLLAVGLLATYIIVQNQRLRIPLLEEKPFELKAEMSTAQAVTPGPGPDRAGRRASASATSPRSTTRTATPVVTMAIDRKFLPVYKNATILLRPKTGLKDMFLELDPGTQLRPQLERRRVPERRHDPGRQHGAGHEPRPDPRGARRRHPGLPAPAPGRGRPGPERPRQGSRQAARQPRADQPRPRPAQHRGRQAQGEPRQAGPQHEPAVRAASARTARASSSWSRPRTRRSARSRASTPTCSARSRLLGPTLRTTRVALDEDRPARHGPRSDAQQPAAVRPQAEADQRLAGEPRQDDLPARQGRHPAVRRATPASRSGTCDPPPRTWSRRRRA